MSKKLFEYERLTSDVIQKVDCPGCEKHVKITINDDKLDCVSNSCVMIEKFLPYVEHIKNLEVFEDDIWVITFPKCGTTWTQEMIWLINNNLDFERAKSININERFPFMEVTGVLSLFEGDSVGVIENMPRQRHIKSHLPKFLLPNQLWTKKPKIIYVVRNPKDVVVSFYHHYRNIVGYRGEKADFYEAFLNDLVIYAPFNDHILDFYNMRNEDNILFLSFERMKRDIHSVIRQTMTFLNKQYSDSQVDHLAKHLSFDEMKANPACNNVSLVKKCKDLNGTTDEHYEFMRKGAVGDFRSEFDKHYDERFNNYINSSNLIKSGFQYEF